MICRASRSHGNERLNVGLSDWFHPPIIHEVTRLACCIRVNATDNIQVTEARITISDADGNTLEERMALDPARCEL